MSTAKHDACKKNCSDFSIFHKDFNLAFHKPKKDMCDSVKSIPTLAILTIIIMTRRQLWSIAMTLHDVHAPLHSATSVSSWLLFRRQSAVFRGWPGSLRQFISEQRPAFIAMTCFKAWCAGTLVSSLTTCANSALPILRWIIERRQKCTCRTKHCAENWKNKKSYVLRMTATSA